MLTTRRFVIRTAGILGVTITFGKIAMAQSTTAPNLQALADIRPGDPKEKLAAAMGPWWRDPTPEEAGHITYLEEHFGFVARLDRDGRVGFTRFCIHFDPTVTIHGVHMQMPLSEVRRVPGLHLTGTPDDIGVLDLGGGGTLHVQVAHGRVTDLTAENTAAVYPSHVFPIPRPQSSFNLKVLPGMQPRDAEAPDGWCCGLPRGITQAQWPLSNATGHPMEHHFTVRVPEAYRVKGPQFVALAVFSETSTESQQSDKISHLMNRIFDGRGLPVAVETDLQPFLHHLRNRHPMEVRSKDLLYQTFAMIWLTQEEFTGPICLPPAPVSNAANAMCEPPIWEEETTSQRYDPEGETRTDKWGLWRFAVNEVTDDPNTGRIPVDEFDTCGNIDGYIARHTNAWDDLDIEVDYDDMHFGGTASPAQAMPEVGPFYLEVEDEVGAINFGGGNGHIDLVSGYIDWAQ